MLQRQTFDDKRVVLVVGQTQDPTQPDSEIREAATVLPCEAMEDARRAGGRP